MGIAGFLVMLAIALVVGFLGDFMVSDEMPFGWAVATATGAIGSLLGTALFGGWGPDLSGVFLLPAISGAVVFVALFEVALDTFVTRSPS